jgi:hypothetical protein
MNAVAIGSGGCGKSGQTTKKSTAGQSVEFTMKSPVDLAAGQYVFWEDKGQALTFALDGAIPAKSVKCTCGTNSFETTLSSENGGKSLRLTLPASGSTLTDVTCVKGDLSCKVRAWKSSATVVAEMTATCFACDSASGTCASADSAVGKTKGVVGYVADVTFTFKQDGA